LLFSIGSILLILLSARVPIYTRIAPRYYTHWSHGYLLLLHFVHCCCIDTWCDGLLLTTLLILFDDACWYIYIECWYCSIVLMILLLCCYYLLHYCYIYWDIIITLLLYDSIVIWWCDTLLLMLGIHLMPLLLLYCSHLFHWWFYDIVIPPPPPFHLSPNITTPFPHTFIPHSSTCPTPHPCSIVYLAVHCYYYYLYLFIHGDDDHYSPCDHSTDCSTFSLTIYSDLPAWPCAVYLIAWEEMTDTDDDDIKLSIVIFYCSDDCCYIYYVIWWLLIVGYDIVVHLPR